MHRLAAILLASAPVALAAAARCVGELRGMTVHGDLTVPKGANCAQRDVTVTGTVSAGRDAGLRIFDGVAILGDVRGDRCKYVSFEPLTRTGRISVWGNVEIRRCREASGKLFTVGRVAVEGDFVCRDNKAPCFAVSVAIGRDARVDGNSGGISYVEGNIIGGDLACAGNFGVSDYGAPNTVAGKKLGECANLWDAMISPSGGCGRGAAR